MSRAHAADVIIIGGGPAGSTLASYLARDGISTLLLESDHHPRPHVGESLVPSTTRVFREIDFLTTMERSGFVRKYGATWHPANGRSGSGLAIDFSEFRQAGVDQDYTWHVDRSRFDALLLAHARKLGAEVAQGVRVREVIFEGGFAVGVRVRLGGVETELGARVVVDCSGRKTILGRQLRWLRKDPHFDQYAVHAWFEGLDRGDAEDADHIHIFFLPVRRGWVWQIPISETITSVGVVAEKSEFTRSRHSQADWFHAHSQTNPALARALEGAKRINEFKAEGEYSYCMDRFVGNGFLLVGDAARFVDPIFSSGVSVAAESARFAAGAIQDALREDDVSESAFEAYETRVRRGVGVWYEFITLYYRLLPLFTYFIRSERHRIEVLRLLQGEVYDRDEVPVLGAMREFIEAAESNESHLLSTSLERPETAP